MRCLLVGLVLWSAPLAAQIPIPDLPAPAGPAGPADTVTVPPFRMEPPITPMGALWRSMLVPGWGQAILGRRVTGAAFVFWEGITLTMTVKALHQKGHLERIGSGSVDEKDQEVQDWAVLLAFNHLLSGAEAFVAAMLWDFPVEVDAAATPTGEVMIGLSYDFR